MSTKINTANYEAFYLDYLEGNLGEAETVLLLAFLEEHPHLALEDEMLTYLPEEDFTGLDPQAKAQLKYPDTTQRITADNIEVFLTASVEKQLSPEKTRELQAFLGANPLFLHDLDLYKKSVLQPDLSVRFPAKRSLKKGGRIIPMYLSFAAAASVALVFGWVNYNSNSPEGTTTQVADGNKPQTVIKPVQKGTQPASFVSSGTPVQMAKETGVTGIETVEKISDIKEEINVVSVPFKEKEKESYTKLKPKKVHDVSPRRLFREIDVPHLADVTPPDPDNPSVNFAMVGVDQMKNPIKPITNRIGEVLKQEVDFRTSKAARKKSGGFYLKIGKFELSRKVYDNSSIATK